MWVKQIIDGFNDGSFPEYNFIVQVHQGVFHVLFDFCNQMDIIDEQFLKQILGNIAFICKEFPENFLLEFTVFQRFSVINIGLCDEAIDDFPLIIDSQV